MSGQTDTLYQLQRQDAARAAVVLVDAFQEDPFWRAVFGHEATRGQRLAAFETPILYCLKYGAVWAPSAALEGICAWLPGESARMALWRLVWSGSILSGLRMGTRLVRRIEPMFRPLERYRDEHMEGRAYLYLQILGVASALQGQGYGGKLLRALIEKGEAAGEPIYLETGTERNVSMYERFGFRVVKETVLPGLGPTMWEMVREGRA